MGIYKTYKEAVLANGSANGVFKDRGSFYTNNEKVSRFTLYCNPVDHLETLESFLASGKRLKIGDIIVLLDGASFTIKNDGVARNFNSKNKRDDERFILQAASDHVETPEEKEALDRIPNHTTIDVMNSEVEKGSYNSASEAFDAIDTTPQQVESLSGSEKPNISEWKNGDDCLWKGKEAKVIGLMPSHPSRMIVEAQDGLGAHVKVARVEDLSKPETPAEREQRERLKAAYDLYCDFTNSNVVDATCMCSYDFGRSIFLPKWLTVVDKTGYRKEEV